MTTRLWAVTFDASDHLAQTRWWAKALGWDTVHEDDNEGAILSPTKQANSIVFVPVPEPKTTKNRIHLDLGSESVEHQHEIVERLTASGASRIDIGQPKDARWVVLSDPEGNEFCVVPPPTTSNANRHGIGAISAIAYDQQDVVVGRFWKEALGWELAWDHDGYVGLRSSYPGPLLMLGPPLAPKVGKNRVHFDVAPESGDDQVAEVERLIGLGARRVDIGQGDVPWVVMVDPENNEFCVLTPR